MPFAHRGAGIQALQSGAQNVALPSEALGHPPRFGTPVSDRLGAHGGMPQSHTSFPSITLLPHTDATIVVVVVGVVVGVGPVEVGLGPVVDVVEGAWQQKPTSSGASCTSRARHTSRILTDPLGRPSLWSRAQSTEACAGCIVLTAIDRSTPTRRGTRQGNGIDAMVVLAWHERRSSRNSWRD